MLEAVCNGLAPSESVGDEVDATVSELLGVIEGLAPIEIEAVCVTARFDVAATLSDIVVEPVPLSEPVFEELAPSVNDAVGVRDVERERL